MTQITASLLLFCDECGAANALGEEHCFACHSVLPTMPSPQQVGTRQTIRETSAPPVLAAGPLRPGSQLVSRYSILRVVGQGGYGVVYQARDRKRRNKLVAIKQIHIGKLSAREIIDATDSYNREVALLPTVKRRHLPRIHHHFTDAGHWYLVTDFIQGQTVEAYLNTMSDHALPLKEALDIGIQLCDVLKYLHSQQPPIIFRDVKPANIMRTPRGHIYLIDFGIARRFVPGRAKDTGPLGSPGYAAPEQYGLMQTTPHTDIYGLGATLQTLMLGKDPLELQEDDATAAPPRPLPAKLQALLDEMLEHDSSKRPRNIYEVKWRLERIRQGKWGIVRSYLRGMLLCVAPYVVFQLSFFATRHIPYSILYPTSYSPLLSLFAMMAVCLWPLLFLGQVFASFVMLFSPRKRFTGLGILTGLALVILVLTQQWLIPWVFFWLNR